MLTDGFAPALQECCPSAPECWARAAQRRQPVIAANCGSGQNASIVWPWVGENYRRGGVCLVTANLNHADPALCGDRRNGGWSELSRCGRRADYAAGSRICSIASARIGSEHRMTAPMSQGSSSAVS